MAMLKYFKFPFATSGDKTAIPDTVQPGGEVSYPQGFGPDYELDPGVFPSAKDVPRDETNQLYFDITNALKEYQEFGTPDFIDSAMNGGSPFSYAKFARVKWTDGKVYVSKKNANTSLPSVVADWYQNSQDAEFLSIATTAFEASVTNGEPVYWDAPNNRFDEAVADGTAKQNVIGFADVTNGRVYLYGSMIGLLGGLTANTTYYLSTATPGAITATPTPVALGVAKNATDFFVAPSMSTSILLPADPVSDNSSKAASSGWIRNAMSNIMSGLGFAISIGSNGYIKFPSCLGGWIFQWGTIAAAANPNNFTLPLAYPNNHLRAWGIFGDNSTARIVTAAPNGLTQLSTTGRTTAGAVVTTGESIQVFSLGN